MTIRRLLIESLTYHWRSNFAVLLCVAVATSVLAGALLVGDSMRGSLRDITLDRLGGIEFALTTDRLFARDLAQRLKDAASSCSQPARDGAGINLADPALLLRGSVVRVDESGRETDRAARVQICGVDQAFWGLSRSGTAPLWATDWGDPDRPESIVLNDQLARDIRAAVGDTVLVRVEKPSEIPREAVLGRKDDQLATLRLTVADIVSAAQFGNFKLDATQRAPRNAFLPLYRLATAVGHPEHANTILVSGPSAHRENAPMASESTALLLSCLHQAMSSVTRLDDFGLRIRADADRGFVSLESRRMVLDPAVAHTIDEAAQELDLTPVPVIAYLANSIRVDEEAARTIPYSTIAALPFENESLRNQLQLREGDPLGSLADDDILLNTWAADDLQCHVGDRVTIEYYVAEPARPFETAEATFQVRGIVEIDGLAADPGLVPDYPGITDAKRYADWDPPFPMDLKRVRPRDEEYWDKYRATPKAFIALRAAEQLWGSRFGQWTSIRFEVPGADHAIAPDMPHPRPSAARSLENSLLPRLYPEQFGLAFRPVRAEGLAASQGGTDFGGLFISFSFFLIVSAAILIGLVFRLGVERRARQVGLLLALGYSRMAVTKLLVAEGLTVAVAGSLVGLAGAAGYAWLVMAGLRSWWFAAIGTSLLSLHVARPTLAIGASAGLLLGALAIVLSLRGITRSAPRALLAGSLSRPEARPAKARKLIAAALVVIAGVAIWCAYAFAGDRRDEAMFFIVGVTMLSASLVGISALADKQGRRRVSGGGLKAIARLGVRNAYRNRTRSVLTIGLVAFATFVIVAVGLNRSGEESHESSTAGEQWLVAESSVPLLFDLNTTDGRRDLGLPDDSASWMNGVHVYRFRAKQGEDASCLNLYQPKQPRLLGVPDDTLQRVRYVLGGPHTSSQAPEPGHDILQTDLGPGVIPAIGDANSVKWILHLGLGDRLPITAEDGRTVELEIVALLERSVFQSELLIAESNFQKLFPSEVGYSVFLIEQSSGPAAAGAARDNEPVPLSTRLEEHLSDYGFDAAPVAERIAEYHAVENTYLATFQMLGGLGLMLGTLGLSAVVLRGVLERRGELALLLAVGYRPGALAWLVLAETAYLLVLGLTAGTVAALVAVWPHVASRAFAVPWVSLAGTLLVVLAFGLLSSIAAVLATLRTPLLPALRSE